MTHEEILTTLGNYVDHLIAGSSAEAPLWNIEKVRSGKPNKWNYVDGCMIDISRHFFPLSFLKKHIQQ